MEEEVLIKTDRVRVRIMELEEGEALPWHHHSEVRITYLLWTGKSRSN